MTEYMPVIATSRYSNPATREVFLVGCVAFNSDRVGSTKNLSLWIVLVNILSYPSFVLVVEWLPNISTTRIFPNVSGLPPLRLELPSALGPQIGYRHCGSARPSRLFRC